MAILGTDFLYPTLTLMLYSYSLTQRAHLGLPVCTKLQGACRLFTDEINTLKPTCSSMSLW